MTRYSTAAYRELARVVVATADEIASDCVPLQGPPLGTPTRIRMNRALFNEVREHFARRLARTFAADNPRFNADLWFKECGVERGVR